MSLNKFADGTILKLSDGKEVKVGKITLRILGQFEEWCRQDIMRTAKEFATMLPSDGRAPILEEATRMCAAMGLSSAAFQSKLFSMTGVVKLIHLAQKGSAHDMDTIAEGLTEDAVAEIRRLVEGEVMGPESDSDPQKAK